MTTRDAFVRDGAAVLPLGIPLAELSTGAPSLKALAQRLAVDPQVADLLSVIKQERTPTAKFTPHTGRVNWHTDWQGEMRPTHPLVSGGACLIALLVAIDPFTHQNGATEIMLGSHVTQGKGVPWRAIMPAGDAVAFIASHVLHRREGQQDAARRAVYLGYCGTWIARAETNG